VALVAREGLGAASRNSAVPSLILEFPNRGSSAQDEFGQLSQGFSSMLATLRMQWQALRKLDHFRREGVSNLSHDLRSPLTATVACLETLEQRWLNDGRDHVEDLRLIEVALRNTRNAAQMVRSLGDLAQLDEPEFKLRREVIDVGELLGDIALRFAQRATAHGVSLRFEDGPCNEADSPPPFASLDIELFERAVANLVDNALRFSPAGASVNLFASVIPDSPVQRAGQGPLDHAWVRVSVIDTGPGIPAADLIHLFDRFYQSRQTVAPATSAEGKGLGLAIVKRIVELHDGHVEVNSTLGQGTRVDLFVPFSPP
jgi:signal transduction histidine kinase